ncbi:MAG: hypothetical protein NXI32_16440 [bacterium]|nr:hypothetical protein [bacterium]
MAGRAATAVKSKTKSKPKARSAAKSTAKAKSTASAEKAASAAVATETAEKPVRTRRKAKPETRTRIYWAVFNQSLKRVAVFEFDQKVEAEKRAERLMKSSGDHHFIQKIKATVQV